MPKKKKIEFEYKPDAVNGGIAGENLYGGEIRDVVLDKGLAVVERNRNTSSVGAKFVVAIPEIGQREILHLFSFPGVP